MENSLFTVTSQLEEAWHHLTLAVFCVSTVLCADRVGQMTKTYNDIDAVTRLLEEVRRSPVSSVSFFVVKDLKCPPKFFFSTVERTRSGAGCKDRSVASQEESNSDRTE